MFYERTLQRGFELGEGPETWRLYNLAKSFLTPNLFSRLNRCATQDRFRWSGKTWLWLCRWCFERGRRHSCVKWSEVDAVEGLGLVLGYDVVDWLYLLVTSLFFDARERWLLDYPPTFGMILIIVTRTCVGCSVVRSQRSQWQTATRILETESKPLH